MINDANCLIQTLAKDLSNLAEPRGTWVISLVYELLYKPKISSKPAAGRRWKLDCLIFQRLELIEE